ncbi:MAG: hypothetical protein K2M78_05800 [Lachnospiraceae bacterium]|nr:hypothetical protein [Lachnospiraceae bacterium]
MIRKKIIKIFAACMMTVSFLGAVSMSVHAEVVKETEPNDTKETAELIMANNETAKGAADGTYSGQYTIEGYTSKTDSDWYKVFLMAGDQYMTCNGNEFDYVIEDEYGNILLQDTYIDTGIFGPTAYRFSVTTAGYYYVKIIGKVSNSKSYLFGIGSPTYSVSSCEIPCSEGIINMTSRDETKTAHFDGTALTTIPEEAIAYCVKLSGIRNTAIKSATLTNEKKRKSFSLTTFIWDKDNLASMNMPVASMWTASLKYFKETSFTPVLRVYYAYPVYSTMVR